MLAHVSEGADDAEESLSGGSVSLGSSALELGQNGSKDQVVGLRFQPVAVPQGVRVLGAWVQLVADRDSSDPASLVVEGEAADHAMPFARGSEELTGRSRTRAATPWAPPPWTRNNDSGPDQR
ncbi:MAG: hypothetical protein GWN79_23055, partial [Actinobacteria bacterium]|nr:hypothetical protein [Actinomycetota bacterium]NIV58290.1 hypothetical protein [Actinomycetota bacterium]NIV89840.1 hypothetical protein [Actinomycetota bacterium]